METLKGIEYLRKKLKRKRPRVLHKYKHYAMKAHSPDVGITIPPQLRAQYKSTLGWCAKAVDTLADRLVFRGFSGDFFNVNQIFNLNNPDTFFDSAILSALISSCCFVYISEDEEGFPRLQVIDGGNATGIIDPITGLLTEGYAVLKRDKHNQPELEAYFRPGATDYISKDQTFTITNPVKYPLLVPIINRPDAVRPFGRSRITRACIYYQEYAKRVLERSDITAEFYSFPQKYVVGLSPDAEKIDKWQATVSSFLGFGKDADGDSPKVGQFSVSSMSPFTEQLRTAASGFAGETGLTLDDLGFISDNPSSAEAIKASHETLRTTARKAQRNFGSGFLNVGFLAACLRDKYPYRRNQFYLAQAKWEPVFEPDASTLSLIGDGALKINKALPGYLGAEALRDLMGVGGEAYIESLTDDTIRAESAVDMGETSPGYLGEDALYNLTGVEWDDGRYSAGSFSKDSSGVQEEVPEGLENKKTTEET